MTRKQIEEFLKSNIGTDAVGEYAEFYLNDLLSLFLSEQRRLIEGIREVKNPFEKIKKQAEKQYHSAETMKYLILANLRAKLEEMEEVG